MSSPLDQSTTDVDVDAVPEQTVQESQAPAGAAGSPLPTVGTNAVSEWKMWDPNTWWTDWALPPDPRPSWEQWFDWVNQLQALTPALGEASTDWQTMIGQFEDSLRNIQAMRTETASWTGPSAQTMSTSLDRLEDSITTKLATIQENPGRLQNLAQTINDAVAPMQALDAEYQQVLQDLNACRQVAERGQPIMLNLATQLLQTGTDVQNSVRTDNLAPQPVPPVPLTLTEGPQGPTQQLTQVAGSSNVTDPGTVVAGSQIAVADQPGVVGATNAGDPGAVTTAGQISTAAQPGVVTAPTDAGQPVAAGQAVPGVAVNPADQSATNLAPSTQLGAPAPASTLAGLNAGTAAPVLPSAPVAATPVPVTAPASVVPMAAPVMAGAMPVAAGPALGPSMAPSAERKEDKETTATAAVRVPVPVAAVPLSGSTGVPAGLRGRTGDQPRSGAVDAEASQRDRKRTPRRQDGARSLDAEAFEVKDAGTGTVTAPK